MRKTVPVSVVIPAFNCGRLVGEAVESVLAQTTRPAEIVVVDDGSTDDTAERLRQFAGAIRYVRQPNQGVAAARNRGLAETTCECVAFLDADDVWHTRKLEIQFRVMTAHPELGLLGSACFDWPATNPPAIDTSVDPGLVFIPWERLVVRNVLVTSTVLIRRRVLAGTGFFDPDLIGPEDHDLWLRIAETATVAKLDAPLTGYRNVPGSLSKQARRMEEGMHRILRKLDERGMWKNRLLLRQKAYSYVNHRCAFMYGDANENGAAMLRSLRAIASYPFPYGRGEVGTSFERLKRLARAGIRMLGLAYPVRGQLKVRQES